MQQPSLTRRDVIKASLVVSAGLALPFQSTLAARDAGELDQDELPTPYAAAFSAPPVLNAVARDDVPGNTYGTVPGTTDPVIGSAYQGTDYYRLTQRPTSVEIFKGTKTTMWGYNGSVPGPTIRTYRNGGAPRRVVMQQINGLPATHPTLRYVPWTSTHLHGSPSKPQFDGYASDVTQPGQWKNYQYPNNCTPRTLWYHDHGVHHTAENVYMGLAAQYHVVDAGLEKALGIPRYNPSLPTAAPAQYEVPLLVSDAMFNRDRQLLFDDEGHSGLYGDVILVNGVPWPTMTVEPRKYRFRVVNGSIARGYDLYLSNGQPFQVIATDGGFMHKPQMVTGLKMVMAERYEIVIDFSRLAGKTVQLLNAGVENARDYDHTGKIMQFRVGTSVTSTAGNSFLADGAVDPHPAMTLNPAQATATRRLELERTNGMWVINDQTWDDVVRSRYEQVFANPELNAVEIWEVANTSGGWFHPLHVHLVDFQVLSRNGLPPRPEELGPKDVVYVGEEETVRLLMRFAHEEGRYMIHCHNISHEDHDMMIQYQVGHHDIDCDSINTEPAKSGTPDPLGPVADTGSDGTTTSSSPATSGSASTSTSSAPTSTSSSSTTTSSTPTTTSSTPTTTSSTPTTTSSTPTTTSGTTSTSARRTRSTKRRRPRKR